tara:strand:+ start:1194 stop:4526 length:3333 start_codon:yes stop_codon:yes gene_type:complete
MTKQEIEQLIADITEDNSMMALMVEDAEDGDEKNEMTEHIRKQEIRLKELQEELENRTDINEYQEDNDSSISIKIKSVPHSYTTKPLSLPTRSTDIKNIINPDDFFNEGGSIKDVSVGHAEVRRLEKTLSSENKEELHKSIKDGSIKTSKDLNNHLDRTFSARELSELQYKSGGEIKDDKDWTLIKKYEGDMYSDTENLAVRYIKDRRPSVDIGFIILRNKETNDSSVYAKWFKNDRELQKEIKQHSNLPIIYKFGYKTIFPEWTNYEFGGEIDEPDIKVWKDEMGRGYTVELEGSLFEMNDSDTIGSTDMYVGERDELPEGVSHFGKMLPHSEWPIILKDKINRRQSSKFNKGGKLEAIDRQLSDVDEMIDTEQNTDTGESLTNEELEAIIDEQTRLRKRRREIIEGYAEGGEIEQEDLFENYENLPENIQSLYMKWSDKLEDGADYPDLEIMKSEFEEQGYTFDYDLGGTPHSLQKMARGGEVKYYDRNERGIRSWEVYTSINNEQSVGSFSTTLNNKMIGEFYLFLLDEYSHNYYTTFQNIPLKSGEMLFRYETETSRIGKIMPLIKVNVNNGRIYFMENDTDQQDIVFSKSSEDVNYLSLDIRVENYQKGLITYEQLLKDVMKAIYAKGGEVSKDKMKSDIEKIKASRYFSQPFAIQLYKNGTMQMVADNSMFTTKSTLEQIEGLNYKYDLELIEKYEKGQKPKLSEKVIYPIGYGDDKIALKQFYGKNYWLYRLTPKGESYAKGGIVWKKNIGDSDNLILFAEGDERGYISERGKSKIYREGQYVSDEGLGKVVNEWERDEDAVFDETKGKWIVEVADKNKGAYNTLKIAKRIAEGWENAIPKDYAKGGEIDAKQQIADLSLLLEFEDDKSVIKELKSEIKKLKKSTLKTNEIFEILKKNKQVIISTPNGQNSIWSVAVYKDELAQESNIGYLVGYDENGKYYHTQLAGYGPNSLWYYGKEQGYKFTEREMKERLKEIKNEDKPKTKTKPKKQSKEELLKEIENDMRYLPSSIKRGGSQDELLTDLDYGSVAFDTRNLGSWSLPQDVDEDDEDSQDYDWEEWNDYTKYNKIFKDWGKEQKWYKKVDLDLDVSEKNWVSFQVRLKK